MNEKQRTKQAKRLNAYTEPGSFIAAWLKGDEMKLKFILYCENNPVDLGIEDAQGSWDMTVFRRHIQSCGPCQRFLDLLGLDTICDLELRHRIAKGNSKAALYPKPSGISSRSNRPHSTKKEETEHE